MWRNTGNGFSNINAGLTGVWLGSVAWGDYDNDGRLDILLTGLDLSFNQIAQVWRNTGSGFVNIGVGLSPVGYGSAVAWGDYDNDGRLDILLTGNAASGPIAQVWRNNTAIANTVPAPPTGLAVSPSGTTITLNWNSATDSQTPAAGLNYNVRVGTTPGGQDIVSPMSAADGFRRLPQMGYARQPPGKILTPIELGRTYYWSVQAVDTAFAGSAFAPEQSFTINTVVTPPNGVPVAGDLNGDGIVDQSELAAVLSHLNGNGIVTPSDLDLVLANYWPYSPWLYMTNVAGLGGTNVSFALSNSTAVPQRSYRLRFP